MVSLPGLKTKSKISRERNLPRRRSISAWEALLKNERYRRAQSLDKRHFDEEYFDNFEVELDVEEEGFRVLSTKTIVEEVSNSDHQISLREVQEVAAEAQLGDSVVLDVTPDQRVWSHGGDANQAGVGKTARPATPNDSRGVPRPGRNCSTSQVLRFERQSVLMAVSSGFGQPEVEAELPKQEQLPNDNYRANATFKVYQKSLPRPAAGSPTGSFQS